MGANLISKNKYLIASVLIAVLYAVQFLFSRIGWYIAALFDCSSIDSDNLFAQVSIHHIVQMIFAIAAIFLLYMFKNINGFKLHPKYDAKGIKYTVIFCAVLGLYYLIIYIIGSFTHTINTYDYELNHTNIIGTLGFQLFLSGPSEEILFRSLPITLLLYALKSDSRKDQMIAVISTAMLFGLAHINVFTFSVPVFQVCYAFVLGIVYGITFIRTKSVIYPMIMHSLSNVISVGGCYLYMLYDR
ncbi:MAG: CPBP family intramembrane metalloprotease [Lachnospiraceae bacterium]|nr:CPBP family intramembrane metalloprotease [Lachnospiraceae bacterium]